LLVIYSAETKIHKYIWHHPFFILIYFRKITITKQPEINVKSKCLLVYKSATSEQQFGQKIYQALKTLVNEDMVQFRSRHTTIETQIKNVPK